MTTSNDGSPRRIRGVGRKGRKGRVSRLRERRRRPQRLRRRWRERARRGRRALGDVSSSGSQKCVPRVPRVPPQPRTVIANVERDARDERDAQDAGDVRACQQPDRPDWEQEHRWLDHWPQFARGAPSGDNRLLGLLGLLSPAAGGTNGTRGAEPRGASARLPCAPPVRRALRLRPCVRGDWTAGNRPRPARWRSASRLSGDFALTGRVSRTAVGCRQCLRAPRCPSTRPPEAPGSP